jgi:3-oxoadipate enol-lactonase
MSGTLMGIIAGVLMAAILSFVPREPFQKKLDELPSMGQKADGHNLHGWTYERRISPFSGASHFFYSLPSHDSSAPTFLFLHGFNTDGRAFQNLKGLSAKYNLIAYNFPEESSYYTGKFTDFAEILDDFCATMGIDTVHIAGNSIGGAIALSYAAHTTDVHVAQIILISSQIFGATEKDRMHSRAMSDKLLKYPDYKLYFLLERSRLLLRGLERAGYAQDAPQEILVVRRIGWYREVLLAMRDYNGLQDLAGIRCPITAFHGSRDHVIPLKNGRTIAELIPGAQFEVIDGYGHAMVYLYGQELARRLLTLHENDLLLTAATLKP